MSTFNTSTRREDISVRLKSQNIKNAKEQTRQLEEESRKMEDRLQELKMAMSREKEERERQGGFWRTGQTGTLHSYAHDVLQAKPPKQQRNKSGQSKVHVHVLKDEPIILPSRNKGPGTMGYIASKKVSPKDSKKKGSQCGQCENRGASVTCVQCSEHYCAGCFAAFHLKGALKKHRSVPIQANTPRHFTSPRYSPPSIARDLDDSHLASGAVVPINRNGNSSRNVPEGASGVHETNSLLLGDYDESGSAASFQDALKAWRCGDTQSETTPREQTSTYPTVLSPQRKSPRVDPHHAVEQVEHSTSTLDARDQKPVDVTFNEHGISYAERLLLKQHRKTDVEELPSGGTYPHHHHNSSTPPPSHRSNYYDNEENLQTTEGHVDFEVLYNVIKASDHESVPSRSGMDSGLSIIELPSGPSISHLSGIETTTRCQVEEVEDVPGENFRPANSRQASVTPKPVRSRIAFTEETEAHSKGIPPFDKRVPLQSHYSETSINRRTPSGSNLRSHNIRGSKSSTVPYVTEPDTVSYKCHDQDLQNNKIVTDEKSSEENRDAIEKRIAKKVTTGKSRPSSRAKSAARPKSRSDSRARSRAASRLSSRMDGLLTKTPSNALHHVAQLSAPVSSSHVAPLSGFFLAGLQVEPESSNMTENSEQNRLKQYRVSHRLYQMAPRSWRPESSIGDTISVDKLPNGGQEEITLSYTYSGQVEGSPLQVHTSPINPCALMDKGTYPVRPPSAPKSQKSPSARSQRVISPNKPSRVLSPASPYHKESGRQSRAIVVEGEDMSRYDDDCVARLSEQRQEDGATLDRLEWELASETGRITGDGKLSRLEIHYPEEDDQMTQEMLSGRLSRLTTPGPGYDIQQRFNDDDLMDDFEEMEKLFTDEEAVKKLL